jgi:ribosome-associated heat shock protein Hsp15
MDVTRVDRWLWAVRVYPTRTAATEACRAGHVRLNRKPAKASSTVVVGDRVAVRVGGRDRDLEVVKVVDKRLGAPLAAVCLVDHSPPPPPPELAQPVFARDPASGRPTKRDRRDLDRLRGRGSSRSGAE